jgi:hypothetical protein
MSDAEYTEFLDAVGKKYLTPSRLDPKLVANLNQRNEDLILACRLSLALEDQPKKFALYAPLADELGATDDIAETLQQSGVMEGLDAHRETIFPNLRKSAIPNEDLELLRQAGFRHPDAELALSIQSAKANFTQDTALPSEMLKQAVDELKEASKALKEIANKREKPKPKKFFTGISKLSGGLLGAGGNLAMWLGLIPAVPAALLTAPAFLTSCAGGIVLLGGGIGDLKGE